ncbi:hypothetical protein LguiA_018345 [Lonicera macranthoides]
MEGSLNFRIALERNKPYIAVVLLQVIVAGMALFVKATIGHKGMKPSIFVVYRQAFATLFMALFVLFLESKKTAQLSFSLLCKIFLVSLFGITLTFNLYAYGLKYASATMAAASSNMVLVITFVLAVILRQKARTGNRASCTVNRKSFTGNRAFGIVNRESRTGNQASCVDNRALLIFL